MGIDNPFTTYRDQIPLVITLLRYGHTVADTATRAEVPVNFVASLKKRVAA
jgi:hypothetical protein